MKKFFWKYAGLSVVLTLCGFRAAFAVNMDVTAIQTSLAQCVTTFHEGYYTETRCPTYGGFIVAHNSGDRRSWLIIRQRDWRWDSRSVLPGKIPGTLMRITGKTLEWRLPRQGAPDPHALIVQVSVQDGEPLKDIDWLAVLRFRRGGIDLAGVIQSTDNPQAREQARELADESLQ